MPGTTVHTIEEFKAAYLPETAEAERKSKLTPEELGQEMAERAIARSLAIISAEG